MDFSFFSFLSHFVIGTLMSFFAAIPLGPVNLAVVQTTINGFKSRAYRISVGSAVAELLYCALSVGALSFLFDNISQQNNITFILHAISIPFLIFLGLYNLFKKPEEQTAPLKKPKVFQNGFLFGLTLNLANPGILALWTSISAFLRSKGLLVANSDGGSGYFYLLIYILGVSFGTFLTHLSFIEFASYKKFDIDSARKVLISRIIGWLFVGLGVYQAVALLSQSSPSYREKIKAVSNFKI